MSKKLEGFISDWANLSHERVHGKYFSKNIEGKSFLLSKIDYPKRGIAVLAMRFLNSQVVLVNKDCESVVSRVHIAQTIERTGIKPNIFDITDLEFTYKKDITKINLIELDKEKVLVECEGENYIYDFTPTNFGDPILLKDYRFQQESRIVASRRYEVIPTNKNTIADARKSYLNGYSGECFILDNNIILVKTDEKGMSEVPKGILEVCKYCPDPAGYSCPRTNTLSELIQKDSPFSKAMWRYYKAKSIVEPIINFKLVDNFLRNHIGGLKLRISGVSERGEIIVSGYNSSYILKGIPPYILAWNFEDQQIRIFFLSKDKVIESPYDKGFFIAF
jgi:hypothetical protein